MTESDGYLGPAAAFQTYVDEPERLLDFATRAPSSTDLVVTPEQLHRRNLKRRLAERGQARSSMRFVRPTEVARELLRASGRPTDALDRVDRIRALETLIETEPETFQSFEPLFGTDLVPHADDIEATRSAIDAITGYDSTRLSILSDLLEELPESAMRDGSDLLEGARVAEDALAAGDALATTEGAAVSRDALVREATDLLQRAGSDAWTRAYRNIERLHLAGVSSIEAPLLDLLVAIDTETSVDVQLYLRPGTGPRLAARFRDERYEPGSDSYPNPLTVDATELVATTRTEEARLAVGVVDRLLAAGVSPSDVLVVARDVATIEPEVRRAARQYGRSVSVWTQLRVTETLPYRLVDSLCSLLETAPDEVAAETLLRPLAAEWVAPDACDWEPLQEPLDTFQRALSGSGPRSLDCWRKLLSEGAIDEDEAAPLDSLLTWTREQPPVPTPEAVEATFEPVLSTYRDRVLPAHLERDTDALTETTETARALVRVENLVSEVASKYAEWLDRGHTDESWELVQYLFETIATVEPGRREHANAAVIDIVDATDTWLREAPYVVAVGLVDGEWPQTPTGILPVELRDRILAGETAPVRALAPLERWTEAREYDHFADAVSTATEHLVLTRHQRDADGARTTRSTFLDSISPECASWKAAADPAGQELRLPEELAATLPIGTGRPDGVER
ncbi:hypothetical protein [Haloarchaeobius sp. TZWWS8]|uniref:hypothetical protein n=1 Tax=Haloarchaeobius sp. TZWWS8 TaxID=3446121 RepID=UPI003EBDE3A6